MTQLARLQGGSAGGEFFLFTSVGTVPSLGNPRILVRGPSMSPVLIPGDTLPGLSLPVKTVSMARSSPRASHWAAIARLDNPNGSDPVLVVDGTPPLVDGLPVREGNLVAASSGSNERWHRLFDCAVSETGSWMVRGRTNGAGLDQEVLMRDGEIVLRRGDVLDGVTLGGDLRFLGFGADGREILIWSRVNPAPLGPQTYLFVDRKRVLPRGTSVDVDADGTADPGWSLWGVQSATLPVLSDEPVDIDEDGVMRLAGWVQVTSSLRSPSKP